MRASIGIVQVGRGHTTVDELLRCAHVALSRPRNGQVDCCFFDPKMDAHVRTRALLEKALREAIGGYDLRTHYQPSVHLQTRPISALAPLPRSPPPIHFRD